MRLKCSTMMLAVALSAGSASGQWTRSIAVQSGYDNNAFRNFQGLADYTTLFSAYLAKDNEGANWQSRFYYRGSFALFAKYTERNYHYHQVGVAVSRILDEHNDVLNFGFNGSLRADRQLYDYYDFRQGIGFANVKLHLGTSSTSHFGYRLRARGYANIPELSYTEHVLFARYTHSFATRTTAMLEANYGRKIYHEQFTGETVPSWGNHDSDYGHHQGGMGHMRQSDWPTSSRTSSNVRPTVSQWVGRWHLAQSLGQSTGLSANVLLLRSPGGGIRYLAGQVSGYTSEDELFDDRYGYEGEELALTVTRLLPGNVAVKSGLESRWKDYVNRPALDLTGEALPSGELRNDRQILVWLSVSKSFGFGGDNDVDLVGEFIWSDNRSNDLYYDYRVGFVSVGITTSF